MLDAAKHLSIVFGEEVSEADVLQLGMHKKLRLSVQVLDSVPAKKASFKSKSELNCRWLPDSTGPILTIKSDEIHYLTGVLDFPMTQSELIPVEARYRTLLGLPSVPHEFHNHILLEDDGQLYELQERFADPIYLDLPKNVDLETAKKAAAEQSFIFARQLPPDVFFVVRMSAMRDFEREVLGGQESFEKPLQTTERNSLLTIIAAICDYSDIKHQERGAATQIANMTCSSSDLI